MTTVDSGVSDDTTKVDVCPICMKKTLSHSRKVFCKICKHFIHFQCTNLSIDEFNVLLDDEEWACRSCNEDIFPFNKIVNDEIFLKEIGVRNNHDFFSSKIFNPFDSNYNDESMHIHNDLDLDNYYNDFSQQFQQNNYFLEDDLNKEIAHKKINEDNFSIAHLNIRSIPANLSHFLGYMESIKNKFTIYGFTETWLSNDNLSAYGIDGYAHVGQPRVGKRGGGVSLFIRNNLAYSKLSNLSETTEDWMFIYQTEPWW